MAPGTSEETQDSGEAKPSSFERATRIVTFVSTTCLAVVGVATLGMTIDKFGAEAERARLETQRLRVEVAAKGRDSSLTLSAQPLVGKGHGWYAILASLTFTNAGVQTMLVDHVHFACSTASLSDAWGDSVGADGGVANWIGVPGTASNLTWMPLGPTAKYPVGAVFSGAHSSNFPEGGTPAKRYQANGVGIYATGEAVQASHEVVARFASASVISCSAEIEYRVTDLSRTELKAVPWSSLDRAPVSVLPFTNTVLPLCGESDWATCESAAGSGSSSQTQTQTSVFYLVASEAEARRLRLLRD